LRTRLAAGTGHEKDQGLATQAVERRPEQYGDRFFIRKDTWTDHAEGRMRAHGEEAVQRAVFALRNEHAPRSDFVLQEEAKSFSRRMPCCECSKSAIRAASSD
jgi:hypothetical protein